MSNLRLAALTSHPIQYQAPLFREIADEDGIDLTVYFCSRRGVEPETDEGFGEEIVWDVPLLEGYDYEFFSDWSPVGGANSFFRFNPGMFGKLRRGEPDVLWVHGYESLTNVASILVANHFDVPIVFRGEVMPEIINHSNKRFLIGKVFDHVDTFASIGTPNRRAYKSFGISENRIFHAPYSVDNEFFQQQRETLAPTSKLREEKNIATDRPVVLFVGKFLKRKRPGLLLDAFVEATEPGEATLLYVGDGELRSNVEQKSIEYGRSEDVVFTGFVNQSNIPSYYELSDMFVLPSARENWGLVINEAMNFGLPIVTTEAVGASEDLVDEENGTVVTTDDKKALALAIREYLYDFECPGKVSTERISGWGIDSTADGVKRASFNSMNR
ncbi:glycosyltransferase family 4 protein [Halorubrum sp. GN11GM_10-3_MGM]|uniref:glycosyltransferase family 4 protein n=1 Tax=Halorubrum sp. GN11GM_10-3_MGM TaxID=2518111 RepID=UPI0010F8615F|nr:glycosyltransferase family 4 protein [Halorubrum sp. GN11GM_10-3_MGM]TKX67635.1 glycosyltransferase family 1 protein [Halorubrum sp. GN11GM_10-3_MGM]